MQLVDGWADGVPFLCHESVPGHPMEKHDGTPRERPCAGWAATRQMPRERLMRLATPR